MTATLRAFLTEANARGPQISPVFLRDLRRLDKDLECHWSAARNHWVIYRVARHGTCRSEDYLMKEFDVKGPRGEYRPLGPWVLDRLRAWDKTKGGAVDAEWADRHWLMDLAAKDRAVEEAKKKEVTEMAEAYAEDMVEAATVDPFTRCLRT